MPSANVQTRVRANCRHWHSSTVPFNERKEDVVRRALLLAVAGLLTMLSPLMAGTASASNTGSVATVADITPQALHNVCASSLTMRGSPGGNPTGAVLHRGNLVNTVDWDGAWALVDALDPPIGRGWVVGKYLC
jgi:hypothetical protein